MNIGWNLSTFGWEVWCKLCSYFLALWVSFELFTKSISNLAYGKTLLFVYFRKPPFYLHFDEKRTTEFLQFVTRGFGFI